MSTNCGLTYVNPEYSICNIGLHELVQSRSHEVTVRGEIWHLRFVVINTTSECDVENRINGRIVDADGNVEGYDPDLAIFQTFRGHPLRDYRIERIGYAVWQVEAVYGYKGLQVMPNKPPWFHSLELQRAANIQSSTMAGTKHITKNIWTITWSKGCPDMRGAIEWDGEAVKGVDVPAASGAWREAWKFTMKDVFDPGVRWPPTGTIPDNLVTENYWGLNELSLFQRWHRMVGWVHGYDWWLDVDSGLDANSTLAKYRNKTFRGFLQGSLQFMGAEISQIDTYNCEVTFEFRYEPNRYEPIPSTIANSDAIPDERKSNEESTYKGPEIQISDTDIESGHSVYVHGFDYFQVYYENKDTVDADTEEESDDGTIVMPVAQYYLVHQVSRYCPFGYLGIPDWPMWDVMRDSSAEYQAYIGSCDLSTPAERHVVEVTTCTPEQAEASTPEYGDGL